MKRKREMLIMFRQFLQLTLIWMKRWRVVLFMLYGYTLCMFYLSSWDIDRNRNISMEGYNRTKQYYVFKFRLEHIREFKNISSNDEMIIERRAENKCFKIIENEINKRNRGYIDEFFNQNYIQSIIFSLMIIAIFFKGIHSSTFTYRLPISTKWYWTWQWLCITSLGMAWVLFLNLNMGIGWGLFISYWSWLLLLLPVMAMVQLAVNAPFGKGYKKYFFLAGIAAPYGMYIGLNRTFLGIEQSHIIHAEFSPGLLFLILGFYINALSENGVNIINENIPTLEDIFVAYSKREGVRK